jgi:hypothetical protein
LSDTLTDAHHDWVADTFGVDPRSFASSAPASPEPAPSEDSGGLLGALSHAAAAVGSAVSGAATGAYDAAANLASQTGNAVASTGVVGAAVVDAVKTDLDFGKGVVEGVAAGVTGLVTGVAEGAVAVAKEGYALATDEQARADAVQTVASGAQKVGAFAATAVTDPGKAMREVGAAVASGAEGVARVAKQVYGSYEEAAAAGHAAEFLGKAVGQGAVLVGGALIPGVGEAEAGVVAAEGAVAVGEGAAALTEGAAALGEGAATSTGAASLAGEGVAARDTAEAAAILRRSVTEGPAEGDAVSSTMSEGRTGPIETPKGARGPASGRDFDPDKAGGPIQPKSLDDVKITHEGVDKVESHVSRFGSDPNNDAMMARQRAIAAGNLEASIEDKAFHAHELDEYQRYENLGFKDGIPDDPEEAFQLWNNAHTAALEDYGMSEVVTDTLTGRQRSTLYHPSCDPRLGN